MTHETVLAAMSGGVDSSVAAALLVREGRQVIGATMKTFCYSGTTGPARMCCGLEGISDARAVASALGITHRVFDLEKEFTDDVIRDFVQEYAAGRTPIPCVRCNSFTKFRDLVRRADELGCAAVATGHYARVSRSGGVPSLRRAEDERKDQTYFLWGIPRSVLDRLILPIGDIPKREVRSIARTLGLLTADKPESFEICFVPDDDYARVLRDHLGDLHPALSPGPFVLVDGTTVGEHEGYARFTVGQRKGLPGGFDEPMFVIQIRPASRTVVIGPRESLSSVRVSAEGANWLADRPMPGEAVGVRIRHGAPIVEATVARADDGSFGLDLLTAQDAVTPGQSAVLYREQIVLGGGVITGSGRS
ncbi:MAG: tRNA 2-thiouridine(34) synthase MnmA [Candidatus Palauibacterales bacterium]|nr:tRNA 2-thiouridine(34) synthase MnmA [Candidatus Palauibacterales bacterium]MDP2483527.1 tRNA 2-thiouridine(34) synthase MnmA [Candidatus Palauibacterales bacterium]